MVETWWTREQWRKGRRQLEKVSEQALAGTKCRIARGGGGQRLEPSLIRHDTQPSAFTTHTGDSNHANGNKTNCEAYKRPVFPPVVIFSRRKRRSLGSEGRIKWRTATDTGSLCYCTAAFRIPHRFRRSRLSESICLIEKKQTNEINPQ